MEDHHLGNPAFLECLNSLLSSGEIPGLFTNEEIESLTAPLRETAASMGYVQSNMFPFFTSQVHYSSR